MSTTLTAFECGGAAVVPWGKSAVSVLIEHLKVCAECALLDSLADNRNEGRSTVATMGDRDAKWLNDHVDDDDFSLEISGDALALYREKHA